MGKGEIAILYLIMLLTTGVLLLTWILTYIGWKKHTVFCILLAIWGFFILVIGLSWFSEPYSRPMILTQKDIVGNYVIDKDKFPGKQADWQYETYMTGFRQRE